MSTFRSKHPRLAGLILLFLGLGAVLWSISAYKQGDSIYDLVVMAGPIAVVYGLCVIIEPRLTLVYDDDSIDSRFKIASFVILVIAAIIGLYVRFGIFSAWR